MLILCQRGNAKGMNNNINANAVVGTQIKVKVSGANDKKYLPRKRIGWPLLEVVQANADHPGDGGARGDRLAVFCGFGIQRYFLLI